MTRSNRPANRARITRPGGPPGVRTAETMTFASRTTRIGVTSCTEGSGTLGVQLFRGSRDVGLDLLGRHVWGHARPNVGDQSLPAAAPLCPLAAPRKIVPD